MKKMRNSKRGFTLTEIIVVIAIIVIVASAAFVGIAVVIDNAKENEKKGWRDEHGRELFEVEAWKEVDALTKDAARFFDVTKYKPATPSNTPTPTPSPTPTTAPVNDDTTETTKETEGTTTTSEETEATTTTTTSSGGGSTTVNYNKTFSGGGAKQTVEANKDKKIKSISITWKNNAKDTYTAFTVTYNGGGNGNFYNANNTCGVYGIQTTTTVIYPQSNGASLSGCSGINFAPAQGGSFTIESYTIEYE